MKRERFFWTLSIQEMVPVSLTPVPLQMLIPPPRTPFLPLNPTLPTPKTLTPPSKISSSTQWLPQAFEEWITAPSALCRCLYYEIWYNRTIASLSLGFWVLSFSEAGAVLGFSCKRKTQSSATPVTHQPRRHSHSPANHSLLNWKSNLKMYLMYFDQSLLWQHIYSRNT